MRVIPERMFIDPNKKWTFDELMVPGNLAIAAQQQCEHSRREAMPQVHALLAAGWQMEIVSESGTEPWQWAWRRPGKRVGKPGRRFASTNQEFMALNKENGS